MTAVTGVHPTLVDWVRCKLQCMRAAPRRDLRTRSCPTGRSDPLQAPSMMKQRPIRSRTFRFSRPPVARKMQKTAKLCRRSSLSAEGGSESHMSNPCVPLLLTTLRHLVFKDWIVV
ncbi:unnamed protein product [Symbiodinium pilosum]|uniref:Uncharacterized protein n=1 Tax=Symbiodinium pilosum TaxID=2952 RepID=A0A812Y275_SYMPI|nr:unnamed protein product [Symbiodinium pilosum]